MPNQMIITALWLQMVGKYLKSQLQVYHLPNLPLVNPRL